MECKAAFKKIWLNFGDISEDEAKDNNFANFYGVSWYHGNKIDDYDAEYILKSKIIGIIDEMDKRNWSDFFGEPINIGEHRALTELKEKIQNNF